MLFERMCLKIRNPIFLPWLTGLADDPIVHRCEQWLSLSCLPTFSAPTFLESLLRIHIGSWFYYQRRLTSHSPLNASTVLAPVNFLLNLSMPPFPAAIEELTCFYSEFEQVKEELKDDEKGERSMLFTLCNTHDECVTSRQKNTVLGGFSYIYQIFWLGNGNRLNGKLVQKLKMKLREIRFGNFGTEKRARRSTSCKTSKHT